MNAELLKNKTGGLNQKDINEAKADNKSYEIGSDSIGSKDKEKRYQEIS